MPLRAYRSAAVFVLICTYAVLVGCGAEASRSGQINALTLAGAHQQDQRLNSAHSSSASAPYRFFAPSSFWNKPLAANAPLDPTSAGLIDTFETEIAAAEQTGGGAWINTTKYSIPIYTVPADQPTVSVGLNRREPALSSAWSAVPLPPGAKPAVGRDAALMVWQPSTNRLWEFWHMEHAASGWRAAWGGAMQHVSSNPGVYGPQAWPGAKPWWGVSASSLALVGGLISLEDLKLGQINHALALAIPGARADIYASPARRSDGKSADPLSLPEGAHLRLNPNLNLAALHLPKLTLMMAEAAQRYGIFITDRSPIAEFYAQDPSPTGTDPYSGKGGYFEGQSPSQLLASFPWSQLELLKMELHSTKVNRRRRQEAMRHRRIAERRRRHG